MLKVDEKRKQRLKDKVKEITWRNKAVAKPLTFTFVKPNQTVGGWMRNKVRVAVLKQWKHPRMIYQNLIALNKRIGWNWSILCNTTWVDS